MLDCSNHIKLTNQGLMQGLRYIFSILFICLFFNQVFGAEYQWSVPIEGKDPHAKAFLWIPPSCKKVRGVIFASQVILEKSFCDNPLIRAACQKENLGMIILFRSPITYFKYKEGADQVLQKICTDLANISGYNEIATAPLIAIGHSGGAIGAWNIAYWNPKRVIAILTLHAAAMVNPPEADAKARVEGIPVMAVSGEYESWGNPNEPIEKHWRWLRGDLLDIRSKYNNAQVCEVVQPGAGHFNFDQHLAKLTAMFIQKAAHYRITQDVNGNTQLISLEESSGWLTDIGLITPSHFKTAPYSLYKGDPSLAFWHMDEALAKAVTDFPKLYGGKKDQRVSFVQQNNTLPASWITDLNFEPNDDGISFTLKGNYLKETPTGVANSGQPLQHANQKIKFFLIGGWGGGGKQINDSVFQISFDHFGISRYTNNVQIMAYSVGDKEFKYAEQAGQVKFPEINLQGKEQTIQFSTINNISEKQEIVPLKANSDAEMPVAFFVQSGPAEIRGNELIITKIPPRSKFPVKVTVVAYQWGRNRKPFIQSAKPIERDFYIISEK